MAKTFINNKEEYGLLYNYALIEKEYNKLKVPNKYYRPPFSQLNHHKYFIGLSERRTGKTTNWLLMGMVMNKLYDTKIIYVRQNRDMITPKFSMEIFAVIEQYNEGEYIRKLTDGRYNSIKYDTRRYYYCEKDKETGDILSMSPTPFMFVVSVDDGMNMKSTMNVPTGDLIIFDEFIGKRYAHNEAIQFFDLCSTIIRGRLSPIIVMVANTIDLHSQYFYELEIKNKIQHMKYGSKESITTDLGTKIFVELIKIKENKEIEDRRIHNSFFFGFKNPKLTSITGGEDIWAYERVPHIPKYDREGNLIEKDEIDTIPIYIKINDELIKLTFYQSELLGVTLEVTKATYIKNSTSGTIILVDNRQELLYNQEYKALAKEVNFITK